MFLHFNVRIILVRNTFNYLLAMQNTAGKSLIWEPNSYCRQYGVTIFIILLIPFLFFVLHSFLNTLLYFHRSTVSLSLMFPKHRDEHVSTAMPSSTSRGQRTVQKRCTRHPTLSLKFIFVRQSKPHEIIRPIMWTARMD